MKKTIIVNLERAARKTGADRYQGTLDGKPWQVYIPQSITRVKLVEVTKSFTITIEENIS
jgi:hypothetical protein